MSSGTSLLDVFVVVKPDTQFLDQVGQAIEETKKKVRQSFGSDMTAAMKQPSIATKELQDTIKSLQETIDRLSASLEKLGQASTRIRAPRAASGASQATADAQAAVKASQDAVAAKEAEVARIQQLIAQKIEAMTKEQERIKRLRDEIATNTAINAEGQALVDSQLAKRKKNRDLSDKQIVALEEGIRTREELTATQQQSLQNAESTLDAMQKTKTELIGQLTAAEGGLQIAKDRLAAEQQTLQVVNQQGAARAKADGRATPDDQKAQKAAESEAKRAQQKAEREEREQRKREESLQKEERRRQQKIEDEQRRTQAQIDRENRSEERRLRIQEERTERRRQEAAQREQQRQQAAQLDPFREQRLLFTEQERGLNFRVNLLGDADLRRRINDLKAEVVSADAAYQLAFSDQDAAAQQKAIDRVTAAIKRLGEAQRTVESKIAEKGLEPLLESRAAELNQLTREADRVIARVNQASITVGRAAPIELKREFDETRQKAVLQQRDLRSAVRQGDVNAARQLKTDLDETLVSLQNIETRAQSALNFKVSIETSQRQLRALRSDLQELSVLNAREGGIRTPAWVEQVKRDRIELRRLLDQLEAELGSGASEIGADAQARITRLTQGINEALDSARQKSGFALRFEDAIADVEQLRREFGGLSLVLQQGTAQMTAGQKTQLETIRNEFRELIEQAQRLRIEFQEATDPDQAVLALSKLTALLGDVNDIANTTAGTLRFNIAAAQQLGADARITQGGNFNSLQNNAYQLGQAIEDAAIGYELNGIAGAARGAANNISFIAQNLIQSDKIATRLGATFGLTAASAKLIVPLMIGIGSAIAVTILPRLVEWLEGLNDIELELDDISDSYDDLIQKSNQEVQLKLETSQFKRGLEEASDLGSLLKSLDDLRTKARDTGEEIALSVENLSRNSAFVALERDFGRIEDSLDGVIKKSDSALEILRFNRTLPFNQGQIQQQNIRAETEAELQRSAPFRSLRSSRAAILDELEAVRRNARRGIFSPEAFQNIESLFGSFQKNLDDVAENGDFAAKEFAATFKNNFQPLIAVFESLKSQAREFRELTTERLTEGIDAAVKKTAELQQRQELIRARLSGNEIAGGEQTLDLIEFSRAYQTLIDRQLQFFENAGVASEQVAKFRKAIQTQADLEIGNRSLETQAAIVEKIKEAEQRIEEIQGRRGARQSQNTRFESFSTSLQESVLSVPDIKDNTDALRKATEQLEGLKIALLRIQAADFIRAQQRAIGDELGSMKVSPQIPGSIQEASRLRAQLGLMQQAELMLPSASPLTLLGARAIAGPMMAPGMGPGMGLTEAALRQAIRDGFSDVIDQMQQGSVVEKLGDVRKAIERKIPEMILQ